METHHLRPEFVQHVGHVLAERGATRSCGNARDVDPKLFVIRRQQISPGSFAILIRLWGGVAKKIHVVGTIRLRRDRAQFFTQRFRTEHRTGKRAQSSGVCDSDGEGASLNTSHWRLDDGQLNFQKLLQSFHESKTLPKEGMLQLFIRRWWALVHYSIPIYIV